MRRAWKMLPLLALAACPAPVDYTPQIHVDPRAARRIAWLSHAAASASSSASTDAPPPRPARVHPMKPGEQLGGPNAVGRLGDLVLENDEVVFVIDRLGSSAGFAESGGNLVDAADAHSRADELGQVFTYFGTFPRQGVYDALDSGAAEDGAAWVEARGRELYESKLRVVTRYTLRPPDRALLVETTIANEGDRAIDLPSVGDAIQWGGAEKVAPGKARGFRGPSSGPFVGGVGRFTSYAITSTEGSIDATSGGSWTDTAQRKDIKIAPGARATYARVFVVGERADTASLVSELALVAGESVGGIEVALVDASGKPVAPAADATIDLSTARGESVMAMRAARAGAAIAGEVPPGDYVLSYAGGGGRAGAAKTRASIAAGKTANATIAVGDAGAMDLQCLDLHVGDDGRVNRRRSPCKVTLEGLAGTSTPDLGPAHAAGPARNQITTADGSATVALAPGKYRVTLSRGPEWAAVSFEQDVVAGKTVDACHPDRCTLERVVDTSGYLACDFHQHTMLGADASVGTRDRVVSNVAEGVEIAVASEHNVVADLEPIVKEMHLEGEMVSIAGDEMTTDASRHPWGHANVFPMPVDPGGPRGGAPLVRDREAREVFDELRRRLGGDFVLQINHPRTGLTGYFDQLGFDRARGAGTGAGYDARFDALEVWNGRNVEARDKVLDDFRALLRTGHPVTATADTDTHGIVGQEAGYPRTYVRVSDDRHLEDWSAARAANLVRGVKLLRDVVLTNGPFLRASANGAPVGGIARGKDVRLKVHVECAPWVDVDTVRVVRAREGAALPSRAVKLAPVTGGAMAADVEIDLRVDADDAVFVVAAGSKPMAPVLGGDSREITPWAMTGAIWIDADGDGRALGR